LIFDEERRKGEPGQTPCCFSGQLVPLRAGTGHQTSSKREKKRGDRKRRSSGPARGFQSTSRGKKGDNLKKGQTGVQKGWQTLEKMGESYLQGRRALKSFTAPPDQPQNTAKGGRKKATGSSKLTCPLSKGEENKGRKGTA